jgi:uncharacterized membrane protein (UPF0127 family)
MFREPSCVYHPASRFARRVSVKGNRMSRWAFGLGGFALLVGLGFLPLADVSAAKAQALEKLQIVTASGTHDFSVEVMRTPSELEHGLMFRRFLPQDRGMLFDFKTEKPVMMWMKNTYLPLDMVFISKSGRVVGIAENAEPFSEKIIPSGAPTYSVLEINAGIAAKIDLKIGDEIRNELFGK